MNLFFSTALTLFLVMDSLGAIPTYLTLLQHVNAEKRRSVAIREIFISLIIMFGFFFVGSWFLLLLNADLITVEIAGGVVLFLIASRLIFSKEDTVQVKWHPGAYVIVPIATPLIASPSIFATLMIYSKSDISTLTVLAAMTAAWLASAILYLFAKPIHKLLKDKGLLACQRLMGLLVALIAVQKFLHGLHELLGR